ncbi:glycosyltransferase family 52 [Marinobacter shengliensis]|uniref:glycosyltransferase family 52 n=1 Tax=Marinobacter shengliensis TaxID=1389223 RepID=UPI0035B958DF
MDVFIVRTRLQALIVNNILTRKDAGDRFILVFLHQYSKREDAKEVYELYDSLKKRAVLSFDIVSAHSFLKNFIKFYFLSLVSALSRGKMHLAAFDSYPFALSAKVFPFSSIVTFDDGSANILSWSKYYDERPIRGPGIRKSLLRTIFPQGCARYLRDRTTRHYTIFKNKSNVVETGRVTELDWDWGCLFDDRDAVYLSPDIQAVVLGTPIHDHNDPKGILKKAAFALNNSDLYICHPREREWVKSEKVVRLRSPAEAFLQRLAGEKRIKVFHFNSTVAYALNESENIELVDLMDSEF